MKKMAVTTAGLAAVALSVALAGCGSNTATESETSTSTSSSAATSTSAPTSTSSAAPTTTEAAGPRKTIQDYLKENSIEETGVKRGDPGAPNINLPLPPGWADAGGQTPSWAYGAIVDTKTKTPDDPPSIIAIVSKLTGNVDPKKILEYAPGELQNLPDFKLTGGPSNGTLSGFDAVQLGGSYVKDGKSRMIAQKTVVIPTQDGLYVLQMNADAPEGQESVLVDATNIIDEQTTITP